MILVIEDMALVGRLIKRVLRPREVVVCATGREGLDAVLRVEPEVVLCDLGLPDMSGADVVEAIVGGAPQLTERVVLMTGGAVTPQGQALVSSGRFRVLEKPFSASGLREMVALVTGSPS